MNERHATPAPLRGLRLLPGDTGGDTAAPGTAAPEADTSAAPVSSPVLPVVPGTVTPITMPERVGTAARRATGSVANAARELWLYPDRLVHVIVHGEAETMAEHRAYVESRAWVPDGMEDVPAAVVTIAGLVHYLFIARPLKASMKAVKFAAEKVEQAADRAVSFYIVAAIVILLTVLLAHI